MRAQDLGFFVFIRLGYALTCKNEVAASELGVCLRSLHPFILNAVQQGPEKWLKVSSKP